MPRIILGIVIAVGIAYGFSWYSPRISHWVAQSFQLSSPAWMVVDIIFSSLGVLGGCIVGMLLSSNSSKTVPSVVALLGVLYFAKCYFQSPAYFQSLPVWYSAAIPMTIVFACVLSYFALSLMRVSHEKCT